MLLCTDVASRGLDFPAVTTIVQYDPPGALPWRRTTPRLHVAGIAHALPLLRWGGWQSAAFGSQLNTSPPTPHPIPDTHKTHPAMSSTSICML